MAARQKLEKSAETLKDSAKRMERDTAHMERETARMEDSADRRTELAAERTYAAWVRTGLVALASGVGAKSLLETNLPHWVIVFTGIVLVLFSAFCFAAAVWRQFDPGPPPPQSDARPLHPALLVVVNGLLVLVAIAALIGIWFGRAPF